MLIFGTVLVLPSLVAGSREAAMVPFVLLILPTYLMAFLVWLPVLFLLVLGRRFKTGRTWWMVALATILVALPITALVWLPIEPGW